jgi:hypothetical protein
LQHVLEVICMLGIPPNYLEEVIAFRTHCAPRLTCDVVVAMPGQNRKVSNGHVLIAVLMVVVW